MAALTSEQLAFATAARVARLATADRAGRPHVVPVCYACDAASFYIALDAKPKRVAPRQLKRVRNLLDNPQVALLIDHYEEDWRRLAFLLVHGTAELLPPEHPEHPRALALLRARYPQYHAMPIETQPIIAIRIASTTAWAAAGPTGAAS